MAKVQRIEIPAPKMGVLLLTVKGTSPLICHKWSTKAQRQIEDKQAKKAQKVKDVREPEAEYLASMYQLSSNGKMAYGFPARAFKAAMVAACRYCDGITMTFAKGAFFVMGDILPINKSKPHMRTDIVRVPPRTGGADLRYRGEFDTGWEVDLTIRYNANLVTPEQLMNLLALAGWCIGVGEQRPSSPMKDGTNGMFEVKDVSKKARKVKVDA